MYQNYKFPSRSGMGSLLQTWLQFHVTQLVVRFEPGTLTVLTSNPNTELCPYKFAASSSTKVKDLELWIRSNFALIWGMDKYKVTK